ncbi:MAG: response regulator [Bacteroidota bacterium]
MEQKNDRSVHDQGVWKVKVHERLAGQLGGGYPHIETEQRSHQPADFAKPRILIVEDGMIMAEDMRRRCEALGYRVAAIVATGEEALDIAEVVQPDLVLMDVRLSGNIDGVEAARRMREELELPVVYVTAYSDDATLERAKRTGPFGYLLKPVSARELHTTIEMALYRHAAEQELRESHALSRALLEASPDAVALTDIQGTVVSCNELYAGLVGCAGQSDAIGKLFTEVLSTQDIRRWTKNLPRTLHAGYHEAEEYTFTREGRKPNRLQVAVGVMKERKGTPRYLLITVRTSNGSRRRATGQNGGRREQTALLRQVHQRIDRNLSLVSSVLHIHSRRVHEPATRHMLRGCWSRMEALSLAQRLLSNEEHPGFLDLRKYVESLGTALFESHAMSPDGIALTLHIDGIHLAAEKALPSCLVVHEMIANSLQHAFTGRATGAVTVSAHRNNGSSVAISVSDNGVGMSAARKLESSGKIGFELVRMLTEQLHGKLERNDGEGVSFTLTFPV